MVFVLGQLLAVQREESFNSLAMFGMIMVLANMHWLSILRLKDILAMDKIDFKLMKLTVFLGLYTWFLYGICSITAKSKKLLFEILWFETMYMLIKQTKYLVLTACQYHYSITNRSGFDLSLANKLIRFSFSTLAILLKLAMFIKSYTIGTVYVGYLITVVVLDRDFAE
jgi:hypothetical protein